MAEKKGFIGDMIGEIAKVMRDEDYAPERMRGWNIVWYASMTAVCCAKKPILKGLGLLSGLYSTYAQQKNLAVWMRNVSNKLDKK